jgi:RHS repeat-associated protein
VSTIKRTLAGVYVQTLVNGSTTANNYLFHDQLGNLARITDANGTPISSMDYAAFGSRRDWTTQGSGGQVPTLTTRGFTGQEHIDGNLGLMHFNARMYDPGLGRFLQPDPVIQSPDNAQSWNPYSYCLNNPLTYTDPTGMFSLRQALAVVIGIVAAIFQQYYISIQMYGAAFAVAVAGGFASSYVATGSLKGGLQGAFGAALTFSTAAGSLGYFQNVAAQGFNGGIMELIQGGNFGDGLIAAGLTAAVMPNVGKIRNNVGRTITGALVGGTISEVTGGKFANGAVSGAIQAAMMPPSNPEEGGQEGVSVTAASDQGASDYSILDFKIPDYVHREIDPAISQAATKALDSVNMKPDGEWLGYVYFSSPDGRYVASNPQFVSVVPRGNALVATFPNPVPEYAVAIYHTHPTTGIPRIDRFQNKFGPGDPDVLFRRWIPNFLRTPSNSIMMMDVPYLNPEISILRRGRR